MNDVNDVCYSFGESLGFEEERFSALQLIQAGFSISHLNSANYKVGELINAGCNTTKLEQIG